MALPKFEPSYRYEDYLLWNGDWELYNGIPVSMSPSTGREHQRTCRQLVLKLSGLLDAADYRGCELFFEIDWPVDSIGLFDFSHVAEVLQVLGRRT